MVKLKGGGDMVGERLGLSGGGGDRRWSAAEGFFFLADDALLFISLSLFLS